MFIETTKILLRKISELLVDTVKYQVFFDKSFLDVHLRITILYQVTRIIFDLKLG